ncbi:sugar phosphate isomerase/epimerase [Flavobacteriaceae bacterium]|nr:sugar phosphate isomerase/epimerase [Flavobacteriaceae bacterium]
MKTIKGPALFLAQFMGDEKPFNNLKDIASWASSLGYKGVQIPTWESRLIDLDLAADSKTYCDELKGILSENDLELTELASHLQGQLVAVHPAYDKQFDNFAPSNVRNNPDARQKWATEQLIKSAKASKNLGLKVHGTFSGSLMWQMAHPWPQIPNGLTNLAFDHLAKLWLPILNEFDRQGVDVCYEIHPGEDLHDGITFERFLKATNNHNRVNILFDPSHFVLQQLNYIEYIDYYHKYIKMFHVKDAEFNPTGKSGTFGGYQDWKDRAGRYRSLGDGQIDFKTIFSKLSQYDLDLWAVMEWECCIKSPEQGAREGAPFIAQHIIETTNKRFDDFAGQSIDEDYLKSLLGI